MRRLLILWNTVALLVLFGIFGVVVRGIVRVGMFGAVDRDLQLRIRRFIDFPPRPDPNRKPPKGQGGQGGQGERERPAKGQGDPFKPHRYDLSGRSVVPPGKHPLWDEAAFVRALRGETLTTTIKRDSEPLRVLSVPVREGGQVVGVVQAPYPVVEVERAGILLDQALLALIPLVLLAAWGGALLLTGRVLRPVTQLTQAAATLGAQNLSERLPVTGDDEFATLARTFNGMLERLEVAFEQQKRFTADASHELKTPLTRIKGIASMTLLSTAKPERLLAALTDIDRAADTMAQLVQDLLLLARGDSGRLGESPKALSVRALVEQAQERVAHPEAAPIVLDLAPAELTLTGNESELLRVLVNLLENALRHTPPDGKITVTARPGTLTVTDTGCGVSPEHLARLGERFYRVDSARTRQGGGTGLGLAICKSIVQAHDGTFTIESEPGQGTSVLIHLPA